MKKILLSILLSLISGVILSQSIQNSPNNEELIVLTKSKHDALRKDIEDYKKLLIKYQSVKIEYDVIIADLDRQSKVSEKTFEDLKKANTRIASLENDIASMKLLVEEWQKKYGLLEVDHAVLKTAYYKEKNKVFNMKKGQANLYIWQSLAVVSFISIFIVAANNH